jgi:hypothetical protein
VRELRDRVKRVCLEKIEAMATEGSALTPHIR